VVAEGVAARERLGGQRVLVVDVERAALGERGPIAPDERGLEAVQQLVDHAVGAP
jgi:hypothetical protein